MTLETYRSLTRASLACSGLLEFLVQSTPYRDLYRPRLRSLHQCFSLQFPQIEDRLYDVTERGDATFWPGELNCGRLPLFVQSLSSIYSPSHSTKMMSRMSKNASNAAARLSQISQQFSSQAPLKQQQVRMAHQGTLQKLNTGLVGFNDICD